MNITSVDGMAKEAEPQMKKKEPTRLDLEFERMMRNVFSAAPKIPEVTLKEYEMLAQKRKEKPVTFKDIMEKILTAPKPAGTIEEYIMALAPQPKKKEGPEPEKIPKLVEKMIAQKVNEMPELKEHATILAVKLAALLDLSMKNPEKLNFRKNWVEAEATV